MNNNKNLSWIFVAYTLLLSSCTYDYIYDIYNGNSTKNFNIIDSYPGFQEMTSEILDEYGASLVYNQREMSVVEYDNDENILRIGSLIHVDDSSGNPVYGIQGSYNLALKHTISAPGTSYIIVRVAMNAGDMGYICTDPIELKHVGVNEIILDSNTPVHVELNVPEESLPTRYIITQNKNIEDVLLPIAQANGYSGYIASLYVHEFNTKDEEIKETNIKQSMLGELQIASEESFYFIIEIALYKPNGVYFGAVDVDAVYNLTPHKLLKVNLDNNVKVKSSQFSSGGGIVIL